MVFYISHEVIIAKNNSSGCKKWTEEDEGRDKLKAKYAGAVGESKDI